MNKLNGQLGIDNLKIVLQAISNALQQTYNADKNGDGKIDLSEGASIGALAITAIIQVWPSLMPATQEARDLTAQEVTDLTNFIISLPILPSTRPQAEVFLDDTLATINALRLYVMRAVDFLKPKKTEG